MKKSIFKKDDKVFDIRFGCGIVVEDDSRRHNYPIIASFNLENGDKTTRYYTLDGRDCIVDNNPILSFTEYTIQNFSQKRPINYEDYIGKWGKFYDTEDIERLLYKFGKLEDIDYKSDYKFKPNNSKSEYFEFFEPLTEEQIEILGLTDKNVDNEEHI